MASLLWFVLACWLMIAFAALVWNGFAILDRGQLFGRWISLPTKVLLVLVGVPIAAFCFFAAAAALSMAGSQ